MDTARLLETRKWVRNELDRCVSFWLENGMDSEHGGVYTCLDVEGNVYSADKSVWMQGRCGWTFAYLCSVYGKNDRWLAASKSCIEFLEAHCVNHDAGGRLYFTVTEDGRPLRQRRYCYSESFAAIANAEYYALTGDTAALERARKYYDMYRNITGGHMADPVGMPAKVEPSTRTSRALGLPMILLNMTSVMLKYDPERQDYYHENARECIDSIFRYHVKEDLGCTLETVGMNGELQFDNTAGRVVNPGHDIECSWFIMDYANKVGDPELHKAAVRIFDNALAAGWDKEYGGILYFIDCLNRPPEAYEHDMKLWWPHNEALIASLMIYRDTRNEAYLETFYTLLDYVKAHFAEPEFGEWYGYLRRDGKPTMPAAKGSTYKGPFHLPRCLAMLDTMIGEVLGA
ncbi:MAG: AGE family epimerase/isomerase [Clostridia bacterium]|nr:AGE family epimerase/isomerase [Clostridia bacterium]